MPLQPTSHNDLKVKIIKVKQWFNFLIKEANNTDTNTITIILRKMFDSDLSNQEIKNINHCLVDLKKHKIIHIENSSAYNISGIITSKETYVIPVNELIALSSSSVLNELEHTDGTLPITENIINALDNNFIKYNTKLYITIFEILSNYLQSNDALLVEE